MGKRKAAKKVQGPKKKEVLSTTFPCLFCNHENSVIVKIDKKAGVGHLSCKVCDQKFQCAINYLSASVDVYADWVDACDAVAKEGDDGGDLAPNGDADDDDNDDDIMGDEDGMGGYGGDGIVADDEDY
ncbi:transcription elongation factor [Botrytis cinerea]